MAAIREKAVRVVAGVLGTVFIIGGMAFLVAVLNDTLPSRKLLTAASALLFGWWFLSSGLGWPSPFRRAQIEVRARSKGNA